MDPFLLSLIVSAIALAELGFIYWWVLNKQLNMQGQPKNENEKDLERSNTGTVVILGLFVCLPPMNTIAVVLFTLFILFEILPTYGKR